MQYELDLSQVIPTNRELDAYYDFIDADDEIQLMVESGDTDSERFRELVQIRDAYAG